MTNQILKKVTKKLPIDMIKQDAKWQAFSTVLKKQKMVLVLDWWKF